MNTGYKIKSELSESQIEADVASYLGYITPFWARRFRLIAVDEQKTGADKLFQRFMPIYLQFKVSEGLEKLNSGFTLTSPNRKLQKIRTFRRDNSLPDNPTLYFKLRDKASGAIDFQHNQLLKMHNPPNSYGVYVAPLTLKFDEYNNFLNLSIFEYFFSHKSFLFDDLRIFQNKIRSLIKIIPFLRGHISIPPLNKINSSDHYYSFSKTGNDVAYHSGEIFEGDYRLSSFISNVLQNYYSNPENGFSKSEFITEIDKYYEQNDNIERPNNDLSLDDRIIEYARHIKREWNIKLLIIG